MQAKRRKLATGRMFYWMIPLVPVPFLLLQSHAFVTPSIVSQPKRCSFSSAKLQSHQLDDRDKKLDLNILLLDHYDSFTYNLADLLAQLCVQPPTILAADCVDSWEQLLEQQGQEFDGIVLSPGPGHPDDPICQLSRDCVEQNSELPVLGVCLGHQILGSVYGATIELAPEPVHGQVKRIHVLNNEGSLAKDGNVLWKDVTSNDEPVQVTRYHSLQVSNLEATSLTPTAISDDDDEYNPAVVMSMQHVEHPHFGVQFHPESIGTNATGKQLLYNFLSVCYNRRRHQQVTMDSAFSETNNMATDFTERQYDASVNGTSENMPPSSVDSSVVAAAASRHEIYIHKIPDPAVNGAAMQPLDVMEELLADQDYSFWLDESQAKGQAVSILGASRQRVEYWGEEKEEQQRGLFVWNKNNELIKRTKNCDILTFLQKQHNVSTEHATMVSFDNSGDDDESLFQQHSEDSLQDQLPFAFRGGHVGYLGYEVRHDTARYLEEEEFGRHHEACLESDRSKEKQRPSSDPSVPTAAFLWADRSFVYDHQSGDWYLVGVVSNSDSSKDTTSKEGILDWMRLASRRLQIGKRAVLPTGGRQQRIYRKGRETSNFQTPAFTPNRSRLKYNRNFAECIEHIRQGESYELCLTNQLETTVQGSSPLDLYSILRERNPAPFSAFFNWNAEKRLETETNASVSICCSSPERFVSIKRQARVTNVNPSPGRFHVEAKPIKGTTARVVPADRRVGYTDAERAEDEARAKKLQTSVKDRAENLMIVDLLRNDLSRVCETGSVHVASLMDIESFATVHQMVSTIRGTLDSSRKGAIDVLKACFPGGSMTGAPKLRTMELLDDIEEGVCRGPYSGCLGYVSLNGSMDMNIVIRTAVLTPFSNDDDTDNWKVRIGAGGAITALSDSSDEYEEMMLKASAVMGAVNEWTNVHAGNSDENRDADNDYQQIVLAMKNQQGNMTEVLMK